MPGVRAWPNMARHGRPWPGMAGHGRPCGKTKEGGQSQKKEGGKASGWAPEIMPKHRKSLPNGRQQGGAFGAAPRGQRFAPPPWGSCCLPFGKDFLCLGLISGAHPEAFPPSFFWDCPPSLVFPGIKYNGNLSFIKVWPNFCHQIDDRLWVVLALNKKPSLGWAF